MAGFKLINPKGDLFATGATFVGQATVKLVSSLVLTRLLTPSAYGTMGILMSIVFIIAMLSNIGFTLCIIRSSRGDEQSYLNTAWTIQLGRAPITTLVMFAAAPIVARLYHAPELTAPFRLLSLWFLIDGLESTAFPLAVRRKNSRVQIYSEFAGTFTSTVFTIVYCYFSRTFWGMLYGVLVGRAIVVALSHCFYREQRPRLQWDRDAAKEIFEYTRYVMPSSIITLFVNQFDKAIFLRLFDLGLLGVYSLAGNISAPIESLITKASQMVLYPRCAHNFRTDRKTFAVKYYIENAKLFIGILAIPAALGGAAHTIVTVLYDPRYARAADVLQAFMMRATLLALASPAEDMLIATGESRLVLVGNIYRAAWITAASLLGYHFFGFLGFTYGIALSGLPALMYYFSMQRTKGFLIARYEVYKVAFTCGVAVLAYLGGSVVLSFLLSIRQELEHARAISSTLF